MASKLLPSVTEKNPYLKEQVGNLIFDFVCHIIGSEKAPKITGMLIELPVPQIKQYLQSYEALQMKVNEANTLLIETKKKEIEKQPASEVSTPGSKNTATVASRKSASKSRGKK